ncbi:nuclear transport factor 2 family protein [Pseudomonas sp. HR96]|uniref:YybH family protein n=1 Tax=Pseudomonas sp. HR96 TaxID=1027966 RepID=UPI002A75BCB1|nr:nuclear transport factor 2 family protein [Pseudomonas sp. HR96]WPP01200.1 nuclear transport factor 2 family protein [Pseudomonas sp. HR96]
MSVEQVLQAAATLVEAFASNDRQAYFGAFSEDASFVFHNLEQPLLSRAAYQAVWDGWRRDEGFEVLSCTSRNAYVSLQGDVAIFIHDVATELRLQGELYRSQERETIVFRRSSSQQSPQLNPQHDPQHDPQQQEHNQGRWLACHEHLSVAQPLPSP